MDIKTNCPEVHEVIVVNNGSIDPHVGDGLSYWRTLNILPLRVFNLATNRGFSGGMNFGLQKSTGDIVTALSNDVRLNSTRFLAEIDAELETNPDSLVGPSLYEYDTGWNMFGSVLVSYIEGWCISATKSTWVKLGGFDEIYNPSDFEDVDLSMTMCNLGGSLRKLKSGLAQHLGGKTFGYSDERSARTRKHKSIFAKKWGLNEN